MRNAAKAKALISLLSDLGKCIVAERDKTGMPSTHWDLSISRTGRSQKLVHNLKDWTRNPHKIKACLKLARSIFGLDPSIRHIDFIAVDDDCAPLAHTYTIGVSNQDFGHTNDLEEKIEIAVNGAVFLQAFLLLQAAVGETRLTTHRKMALAAFSTREFGFTVDDPDFYTLLDKLESGHVFLPDSLHHLVSSWHASQGDLIERSSWQVCALSVNPEDPYGIGFSKGLRVQNTNGATVGAAVE
jgi:hypothetical protein